MVSTCLYTRCWHRKKNWCDVSVECAPVKETHPRQRKRCTICREIISTDLPLVPSLSGAACPRRLWLLKLSGPLWYLTHSAVELFTPKTNLKFAQHYRICRKYCRSLNCSFKKSLNGTKSPHLFVLRVLFACGDRRSSPFLDAFKANGTILNTESFYFAML